MKIAYFSAEQSGTAQPHFTNLDNKLGFPLGIMRADHGSFAFTSLDEDGNLTSGNFPENAICILQLRQENRKLCPDDGGARPDYINFFCFDFNDQPIDGFNIHGFIVIPEAEQTFTAEQLTKIFEAKSALASIGYTFDNSDLKTF